MISFKNYKFTVVTSSSLEQTIEYLQHKGINNSFCHDHYLVWQMNFYSNEAVLCREMPAPGRYPPYQRQINYALDHNKPTALIGLSDDFFGLDIMPVRYFGYVYVKENVPKAVLSRNFIF